MNPIYQSLKTFFLDNPNLEISFKELCSNRQLQSINPHSIRVVMSQLSRERFIIPVYPRRWVLNG